MQAVQLLARHPAQIALREVHLPPRTATQAHIRMLAASVNRVDVYMRDNGAGITHSLPQTLGIDGVAEVIAADGLAPGQRVLLYPYETCGDCRYCRAGDQPLCIRARIFGEHRDGTFAQEMLVPRASLVPISEKTDVLAAGALGVAYLTAWRMVFGRVPVGPGWVVLVQGAGGGVSYAAVQLAQMAGARVIVTTSGAAKLAHFRQLGVTAIDYRTEDVAKAVLTLTNGEGVDLVIDNVGEKTWNSSMRAVRRGGSIVTCGATTGSHPSADLQRLFIRQISVHGTTMGSLEEFRRLIAAFEAGAIKPFIDSVFPLAEAAKAMERLEHPDRLGKVMIRIS